MRRKAVRNLTGLYDLTVNDDNRNKGNSEIMRKELFMNQRYFILCIIILSALCLKQDLIAADNTIYKYPGNNKVLIYAPGYTYMDQYKIADDGKDAFGLAEHFSSETKILPDTEASIEEVKSFGDYGTVIIHTHGWFWRDNRPVSERIPVFRSGTKVPKHWAVCDYLDCPPDYIGKATAMDLYEGRLAVSKSPDDYSDFHYVIFPSFIEKYVSELKDSLFYLGYCNSLENDKMWDVLKGKGAKVAFGWDEEVGRWENNVPLFADLMGEMLPDSLNVGPLTAKEAFDNAPLNLKEDASVPVTAQMRTHSPEWENFIYNDQRSPPVLMFSVSGAGGSSQDELYLLWDYVLNEPYLVNKTGGGSWSYPLSREDFYGQFATDLEQKDGVLNFVNLDPLFSTSHTGMKTHNDIAPFINGFYTSWPITLNYDWPSYTLVQCKI
ncbi:MAG: hypothetical protein ABFS18_10860 [Thermodesulfobacteriota bacterium]